MKRIDLPPTNERLIELIKSNPIGRNDDISNIIELLDSIEGPFSIFLDSEWGSGKTFFVKQLELVLKGLNPQLSIGEDCNINYSDLLKLRVDNGANSFLPVYYSAWDNDHWDDPLPSLLLCLASSTDKDLSIKSSKGDMEVIATIVDAILKPLNLDSFGKLAESLSSKDLLEQYQARQALRNKINQFVNTILQERANKLLLIVDELDRCKPIFAVRLLETIKTLFDDDRTIVLAAVNVPELTHSVEGLYGPGIDGARYLSRFFDLKTTLRQPNTERYLLYQGLQNAGTIDDAVSREMINALGMSLRDINRYQSSLRTMSENDKSWPQSSGQRDSAISFAHYCLVPILLAMQILAPDDYQKLRVQSDGAILLKYIQMSSTADKHYTQTLGECLDINDSGEFQNKLSNLKVNAAASFCELIWNSDEYSAAFIDARNLLLSNAFGVTSLSFISRDMLSLA